MVTEQLRNWAGNYTYSAARVHYPTTLAQIQALVARSSRLRALGTRHSFNGIADCDQDLISLEQFDQQMTLDRERSMVTVAAGMRYGQVCAYLHRAGYALHNMASLPHISVAGACATATHGSGVHCGNLATAVAAIELVTAEGDLVRLSRDEHGEQFRGVVVGLGGLGVVTRLTLDVEPSFTMRQDVYLNLPLDALAANFDAVIEQGYSVSLFTDWRNSRFTQVWVKRRISDGAAVTVPDNLFGAPAATRQLHPIESLPGQHCTEQLGVPGPWHERLPHFRMDYTPSSGEELQSEYLVPRRDGLAALQTIDQLGAQVAPLLQACEVRTVAADELWMSQSYQQDSLAIHFTWRQDWPAVSQLLPLIEERLAPLGARPHWAKLFTMTAAQLHPLYPRMADFQQLLRSYDPEGKFRNAFLDSTIFGEQ